MVTFKVDDVVPAAKALPTQPLFDLSPDALVFGRDPATRVIEPNGVHPLLHAIAAAFADHRPLVLSPDAVWLTVLHGVAQHVRLHAEELRPRLVEHAGRRRISVVHDGAMPHDPDSWRGFVDSFSKQLAAEAKGTDLFECDFSTSTDVERTAAHVVMLDAYSPYFSVCLHFICGIPSVTLTGTVEDWQKIRERVDQLPGFGLETWHRSLAPIADQFVRAARGDVDTAFWQRIYSPIDVYDGRLVTGWAARFYPYLESGGVVNVPNPLLELPIGEPRDVARDDEGNYRGPGVSSDNVPAVLSRVIVTVNDLLERENRVVALHAGLVAVAQDADGALRPVAGWHLTPAEVGLDDVIDRVVRDHVTTPPRPGMWQGSMIASRPTDLVVLYHRIGSASLFDDAWRLRPSAELGLAKRPPRTPIVPVFDLADGRCLSAFYRYGDESAHWLVCRVEKVATDDDVPRFRLLDDPDEVPVYGASLAIVLDAALDSGGDFAHLETGRLSELDELERASHDE